MFFREEFNKKNIIHLRWTLIIVIGYIIVFSPSCKSFPMLVYVFLPIYAATNLLLSFSPEKWFQRQDFISLILLLDLCMAVPSIVLASPEDSLFYVTFFLVLLISAITHKAFLVYGTFAVILLAYGITSYMKAPRAFFETAFLLKFPFIFILTIFFRGIIVSYNRIYQEKELLKEDYLELEVLNSVALTIGQHNDLSRFLFRLSKLLTEKLGLERCTAIFIDSGEENCYMVSSDDLPGEASHMINIRKFPALRESLKSEKISEEETLPLPFQSTSRYILKKIPVSFKANSLGTLYLRAGSPKRNLTRREEYFLEVLGRITAIAILDLGKSRLFDRMMDQYCEVKTR